MEKKVYGEGDKSAKLWLVGECPGAQEEKIGRPFVGGAGRVLDQILSETGIKRSECYIDNVVQERPPKNDFSVYYTDKKRWKPTEYLTQSHKRLQEEILKYRPNVIVALGNEPLYALTGLKTVIKRRGSILNFNGIKVIPTIHPDSVMRQYEFKPIVVMDFNRIREEVKTPYPPADYKDIFIINPSFETIMKTLASLEREKYIAFDIETDSENQILCLGLGWSKENSICIPIFYSGNSWWTSEEEIAIIGRVRKLFQSPTIKFIAQNAQYDMIWLRDKWGVEVPNLWLDTMVGFHCIYPELRKGLDFLCSIYTTRPFYKDMPGTGGPDVLWKYNCLDTVVTWECAMEIVKELKEFKTWDFYRKHSHKLIKPLIGMQRTGVKIDLKKRAQIDENLSKDLTDMEVKLEKAVGHPLNPSSSKQMVEFLYTEMGLPPQRNRKTKSLTADEEAIQALSKKFPNPVFDLILDIRKVRHMLSNYIRAPLDPDGRIRCNYVITGTETGRLSSRKSVYGSGTNLQNIDRKGLVRSIFVSDPGKTFVNADLSQAEARVVAFLAKETRLQILFEQGGDIHKKNASDIFGKTLNNVTSDERQLAKTLIHASNYGIGARTFSRLIGQSEVRARELLNQYYAHYPRIKLWHKQVEDMLRKSRVLVTPFNRKRMFFGRWSQDLLRDAIAYVPQSTVSDVLNMGLVNAYNALPQDWEMMLQVHDSVLMQVPDETDPMHIFRFIKHYFEFPFDVSVGEALVIPVEIKTGKVWSDMKELKL